MSQLEPCPRCRRHVRVAEVTCPFCAAELAPVPARVLPVGRLTRAAVFAGAALASACAGSQTRTTDGESANPTASAPDAAVADAAAAPDATAAPDARVAAQPSPDAAPAPARPVHPIPKPYGAPPARARLV